MGAGLLQGLQTVHEQRKEHTMTNDPRDTTEQPDQAAVLDEARTHLAGVAAAMTQVIGDMTVVGLLIGAATAILQGRGGDTDVAAYLRLMADELEADHAAGGGTSGSA
jgi:hypothetical protein